MCESGSGVNLVENHDFESTYDGNDCPCYGLRLDSLFAGGHWGRLENYRREHWDYADHPLVFNYATKQPVLLGVLSQYDCLASLHENMTAMNRRVDANIFTSAYAFYGHLIDVFGSEVWQTQMGDADASLRRTMSYQKTNRNMLVWDAHGNDSVTREEMKTCINDQMFYGMFPSNSIASPVDMYDSGRYWYNATLYERDRDLFKKYVPIIKDISAAGWEPVPYATCDNPNMRFERYGNPREGLYYTVASRSSMAESGVLLVDLSKLGFDGTTVEVKELVTNTTSTQKVVDGKARIEIPELHSNETLAYKISL